MNEEEKSKKHNNKFMSKILFCIGLLFFMYIFQSCSENSSDGKLIKAYYSNGTVAKEYYLNEEKQKQGVYKEYYENGKIRYLYFYQKDLLTGEQKEYYDNGKLKALAYYTDARPDSILKWYYPNGILKSESYRLRGKLFGVQKEYFINGALKDMYFMKNDSDQIFSFSFSEEGEIISNSKRFIYCVYERDTLLTSDTVKLVYYTMIPPKYKYIIRIVVKGNNGYYHSEFAELDSINNNIGILVMKDFVNSGDYEIGLVLAIKSESFKTAFMDSLFIPIDVQ